MTTLWDTVVSDAAKVILNTEDLAEDITYTVKDAESGTTVPALVERGMFEGSQQQDGHVEVTQATVTVAQADVATPQEGDTFTFEARRDSGVAATWVVKGWDVVGAMWAMSVVRVDIKDTGAVAFRVERT